MTRAEALALALETVEKLAAPPLNARGYVADGAKAPTLADRTTAVLALAEFLLAPNAGLPEAQSIRPACHKCGGRSGDIIDRYPMHVGTEDSTERFMHAFGVCP